MNRSPINNILATTYFWEVATILIVGSVYIASLLPGIGDNGDTAKFQFIGRYWGTPHSTGYPTYIFLNHLFTRFFPLGSIAYRANLLSAFFTVIALIFFSRTLILLNLPRPLAFFMAMTLGFAPTVWRFSLLAEVYSLHLLFVSLVCYFLIAWHKNRRDSDLLTGLGIYAFSFGNHMTSITMLPAIVYLIWITNRRIFLDMKKIAWVFGSVVLSALQYTYFVWRTLDPNTIHLEMSAPDFKTFLWYVSGSYFRTQMFAYTPRELILDRIPFFGGLLWDEMGVILFLAIIGFLIHAHRDWRTSLFLLLGFAGNSFYALNYRIQDIFPYFIPSYFFLVIFAGLGVLVVQEWLFKKAPAQLLAVIWVLPAALLITNYEKVDLHEATSKINETQAIVNHTQPGSLVITSDYNVYEYMMYYWAAEGWRDENIYLMTRLDVDAIRAYIEQDQSIYLPLQRIYVPPGLNVYFAGVSEAELDMLNQAGIPGTHIEGGLLYQYIP